jgi:hypothetical protein
LNLLSLFFNNFLRFLWLSTTIHTFGTLLLLKKKRILTIFFIKLTLFFNRNIRQIFRSTTNLLLQIMHRRLTNLLRTLKLNNLFIIPAILLSTLGTINTLLNRCNWIRLMAMICYLFMIRTNNRSLLLIQMSLIQLPNIFNLIIIKFLQLNNLPFIILLNLTYPLFIHPLNLYPSILLIHLRQIIQIM